MRYLIFVLLSIVALSAFPRKCRTMHSIPKNQDNSYEDDAIHFISADSVKSIKKDNYTLLINYSDGNPFEWGILGHSRAVQFDSDPRLMPVYYNPASPIFFHAFPDCKKLGAFRKLSETPIEDFLNSNKSAAICPECMQRDKVFFFISQFILDDPK